MIENIHLQNFTIIDRLDLDFKQGMTVLTGETGAGKSIIIDAIELALGARLDNQVMREGCDRAEIHVTFNIANNEAAKQWLTIHEFLCDVECILRRSISKEGRSRCFINGNPVTQQFVS